MNSVRAFDFLYAARQLAAPMMAVIAPAVVFAWLVQRRLLMRVVVPAALMAWSFFVFQTWASIARIWAFSGVPSSRVRIGPSYLTLLDNAWILPVTLWTPLGICCVAMWLWRRRHTATTPMTTRTATIVLCGYLGLATLWTSALLGFAEYDHEDTVFAAGFTLTRWNQLHAGMTRSQIYELLGQPLDHRYCAFAADAECWVSNSSAGQFAAVWFDRDQARRVFRWYSD